MFASSWRHLVRSIILTLLFSVGTSLVYGADVYDPATNQLTISSVTVGSATYSNVVVTVASVVNVANGTPTGSHDVYDPATNQLTIPSVQVGSTLYANVTITVGSIVSVGGTSGGNASVCFDPTSFATGTTFDLINRSSLPTSDPITVETQGLVQGPQTFNGQNAIGVTSHIITLSGFDTGSTQDNIEYFQVQYPKVLTLGGVSTTGSITQTTVINPPVQMNYSLSSGQSDTYTITPTVTTTGFPGGSATFLVTNTFLGFEDVTVPAGTFAGACKWITSSVNTIGQTETTTTWFTRKGVQLKVVESGGNIGELMSGTLNGGPVGP